MEVVVLLVVCKSVVVVMVLVRVMVVVMVVVMVKSNGNSCGSKGNGLRKTSSVFLLLNMRS